MGTINHGYIDRVKYILGCEQLGSEIIITEPIGWNSDNKEFARNTDYDGIVAKFSNDLKFVDDAADYIQLAFDLYDVLAKIKLTKYERHPKTDKWVRSYWGYLDLMTKQVEDNKFSVKFNSGGLQEDIKSREDTSIEIDRTTTIDGIALSPIQEKEVLFRGRRIFLKSRWEPTKPDIDVLLSVSSKDGNTRNQTTAFALKNKSKSHEEAQDSNYYSVGNENNSTTGMMFLNNFDRERSVTIIGKNIKFKTKLILWVLIKIP